MQGVIIINKPEGFTSQDTVAKVKKILTNFLGKQKQLPPMYSAIKVKRKKAI